MMTTSHHTYLLEVESGIEKLATGITSEQALKLQQYHGSKFQHLGLNVPTHRQIFKTGYSLFTMSARENIFCQQLK